MCLSVFSFLPFYLFILYFLISFPPLLSLSSSPNPSLTFLFSLNSLSSSLSFPNPPTPNPSEVVCFVAQSGGNQQQPTNVKGREGDENTQDRKDLRKNPVQDKPALATASFKVLLLWLLLLLSLRDEVSGWKSCMFVFSFYLRTL